jgi:hypothetical protein
MRLFFFWGWVLLSIVYCLLARSCLGVRAARCVVAPGVGWVLRLFLHFFGVEITC